MLALSFCQTFERSSTAQAPAPPLGVSAPAGPQRQARLAQAYLQAAETTTPLGAALVLAAAGQPIIVLHGPTRTGCSCANAACTAIGKHPRLAKWQATATTSPTTLGDWEARWPGSNYGVVTGIALDVLDVDGQYGFAALAGLRDAGRLPVALALVHTGGGGLHYVLPATGHRAVVLATGAASHQELRLKGAGGYVVAPGSVHHSSALYQVATDPAAVLAALVAPASPAQGDALRAVLPWEAPLRAAAPPLTTSAVSSGASSAAAFGASSASGLSSRHLAYTRSALSKALARVAGASSNRNDTLNREAYSIARLAHAGGLNQASVQASFLAAAQTAGLPSKQALATFTSGYQAGLGRPKPILVSDAAGGPQQAAGVLSAVREQVETLGVVLLGIQQGSKGQWQAVRADAVATDLQVMRAVLTMASAQGTVRPRVAVRDVSELTGFTPERSAKSLARLAGQVSWVADRPVPVGGRGLWLARYRTGSHRSGTAAIFTISVLPGQQLSALLAGAAALRAKGHTPSRKGKVETLKNVAFCTEAPPSTHPIWGAGGLPASSQLLIGAALRLGADGQVFSCTELARAAGAHPSTVSRALRDGPGARTLLTAGFLVRHVQEGGTLSRSVLSVRPDAHNHDWDAVAATWGLVDQQPRRLEQARVQRAARDGWQVREASRAHLFGRPGRARDDLLLRRCPAGALLTAIAVALVDLTGAERAAVRGALERAVNLDRPQKLPRGTLTAEQRALRQVAYRQQRTLKAVADPVLLAQYGLVELAEQLRMVLWAPPGSLAPTVNPAAATAAAAPRALSVVSTLVVTTPASAVPTSIAAVASTATAEGEVGAPVGLLAALPAPSQLQLSWPRGALVRVPAPRRPSPPLARVTGDQQDLQDQADEDAQNAWGQINVEAYVYRYGCLPPASSPPAVTDKQLDSVLTG